MWSVDYGKVTPLLVKGMQDLKAEMAAIKKVLGLWRWFFCPPCRDNHQKLKVADR
jgi:hypothetical protein